MSTSTDATEQSGTSNPDEQPEPKTIVVLSDGTGNAGGRSNGTNVWRIREAVESDRQISGCRQVTIYEDGVGTDKLQPLAVVGLAFAFGLSEDLVKLYRRLIRVYEPGDRIFLFGFSRGAFTIRLLAYMLHCCGMANKRNKENKLRSPAEIDDIAKAALRAFKLRHTDEAEKFRRTYGIPCVKIQDALDRIHKDETDPASPTADQWQQAVAPETGYSCTCGDHAKTCCGKGRVPIRFIGVWDTVDAVGLPFDNVSQKRLEFWRRVTTCRGLRFLRLALLNLHRPRKKYRNNEDWKRWNDDDLHPCIQQAYHAVSIDDERKTFHPVLWLENENKGGKVVKKGGPAWLLENVEQVWFSGVHANVGGGYAKDHLSYVPLEWMMRHARNAGLVFNVPRWIHYHQEKDATGKLYDSRSGGAALYRYKPRDIRELCEEVGIGAVEDSDKPRIHESVLTRIEETTSGYAPFGTPLAGQFTIVEDPDIDAARPEVLKNLLAENESHQQPGNKPDEPETTDESGTTTEPASAGNDLTESDSSYADRVEHCRLLVQMEKKTQDDRSRRIRSHHVWESCHTAESVNEQAKQNAARRTAQQNTTKLSDLRLVSYYAFCVWIVTFLVTGAVRSVSPSDATAASAANVQQQICTALHELFGPVFIWPGIVLVAALLVVVVIWLVRSFIPTFLLFAGVVLVAAAKGACAVLGYSPVENADNDSDEYSTSPGVWTVGGLSVLVAILAAMFQPLIAEAFLIPTPAAVEDVIKGVVNSRGWVAFFAFTLAAIVQVSRVCQSRIRDWGTYGWQNELQTEVPVRPALSVWEKLGATYHANSYQGRFLELKALPVGAITILLVAVLLFVWSAAGEDKEEKEKRKLKALVKEVLEQPKQN